MSAVIQFGVAAVSQIVCRGTFVFRCRYVTAQASVARISTHQTTLCPQLCLPGALCNVSRRVGRFSGIIASYGVNTFLVKHPKFIGEQYPNHVKSATFYGRLINTDNIVNLDMSFTYDAARGGYIGTIDVRDPGSYTLQVSRYRVWFQGNVLLMVCFESELSDLSCGNPP